MKRDWTSRTTILLVGAILVVINLIGLNLFGRLDLTDDRVYSLSEASIDLVESLDDPVTITAYFTKDLPAPYSTNRRFLKDKLDDYRAYGGAQVQYRFVDPADSETDREEATGARIPPVQIQVIESDNVQLKNAYMGLLIEHVGEREVIPVVQDLSTLEYNITSAMRRLTRESLPTVGFLGGHGEPDPQREMGNLFRNLGRNYDVQVVSIQDSVLMPRPDVLLIASPTDTIPDTHLKAIDNYFMAGGRLGVMVNAVSADLQAGQAMPLHTGLDRVLAAYGARINTDLVLDEQSSAVTVQRQQGFFAIQQQIEYPFFPIATRFAGENLMVSRLRDVVFYFVSSIDTSAAVPDGVTVEPLIYSSSKSSTQQGFFMIQPMPEREPLVGGPYTLAAAYRGTFPSAMRPGMTSAETRMVVVGDGDFINESLVGAIPGNQSFGLNMVDWLAQDDALLAIRSKTIAPRQLGEVSDGARPWIKYGNMLGPALLIVLFGLWRWRTRRNRQIVLMTSS